MARCTRQSTRSRVSFSPSNRSQSIPTFRRLSRKYPSCNNATGGEGEGNRTRAARVVCGLEILSRVRVLAGRKRCRSNRRMLAVLHTRFPLPPPPPHTHTLLYSQYVVKYFGSYFKNTDLWVSERPESGSYGVGGWV